MIIVKLLGGLGNQMFQYSIGRAFSIYHNVPLKLDLNFLLDRSHNLFTHRNFELNSFNIRAEIASEKEIEEFKNEGKSFSAKVLKSLFNTKRKNIFIEKPYTLHLDYIEKGKDVYLDGYWQCEQYFKNYRQSLLKDFELKNLNDEIPQELKDKISNSNSVSIHIRRGDYVTLPSANQHHGLCTLQYYQKAVNIISTKVEKPEFFIFSDEPDWIENNFSLNTQHKLNVIDYRNTGKTHWDLRAMSFCKHNIIANSSYSWWGAWLNQNPLKIVIAPSQWINNQNIDTSYIIPDGWLKI